LLSPILVAYSPRIHPPDMPLTELDIISLQRQLDDIGRTKTDVSREKS
jgi:hypothetical protein